MAKGVSISVASDTRDFLKGIKTGVIEPLEDASDALQDIAKDGDRAGDKLEDAMRDAQKDTERLADKYDELGDKIRDSARRGGKSMREETHDSTSAAARDLGELKDEAIQNASETFSSFDGSVDGLVDGIQGTFGGIVSSLGPIGAAAGAAVALGIGFATSEGQKLADAMNEAKERTAELAGEIIEADGDLTKIAWGDKFQEWGLQIEDSREWFEFWQDDAKTAFETAKESATKFGLSTKDVARGLSGIDADAATRSIGQLTDQMDKLTQQRRRASGQEEIERISGEIRVREELVSKLREQGGVTEDAIALQKEMQEINAQQQAQDEANARAIEARTDATNALQGALDEGVSSYAEFQDAETGALDPSGYINAMAERAAATTNFNKNVQSLATQFGLTQEEVQAILDQGISFAPMLQSIIDSGLSEQFTTQIKGAVGGGQEILDGTPLGATVKADADTADAEGKLGATAAESRTATIGAKADAGKADGELNKVASTKRTAVITAQAKTGDASRALGNVARARVAPVTARVYTGAAEAALNSFINRQRTIVVTVDARDREGKPVK